MRPETRRFAEKALDSAGRANYPVMFNAFITDVLEGLMTYGTRETDGITVVDVKGVITFGAGATALRELIRDLLGKGKKRILLNLGEVTYIDSSGIGELVHAYTSVTRDGGELKLLNLTKNIHDQFEITKLATVFDITADERTAIASFRKS